MNAYDEKSFQLISFSGTAKSFALEALRASKRGQKKNAKDLLAQAKEQILFAQKIQEVLLEEFGHEELNILMVHAQDHLMTSLTVIDLVTELLS